MTPRPLLLAAVLLLPCAASAQTKEKETHVFNQEGKFNEKDKKRAKELAEKHKLWKDLTDEQREAVLQAMAIEIHGRRKRVGTALIQIKEGKDLNAAGDNFCSANPKKEKPIETSGFKIVFSEQDKEHIPAKDVPFTEPVPILPVLLRDLFADNSWELKPGAQAKIKEAVDKSFAAFDKIKAANPGAKASVGGIHIESSASAVFNNAYADPKDKSTRLTHRELSRARANTLNLVVRAELAKRGVLWDKFPPVAGDFSYSDEDSEAGGAPAGGGKQIFTDSAGGNGNGTTGPDSPYNCPTWLVEEKDRAAFAEKFCVKGDSPASDEAKEWARKEGEANAKGDKKTADFYAAKIEKEYEQFRYVRVDFDGVAQVSGSRKEGGQQGEAEIILIKVGETTKGGGDTWDVVSYKRSKKHDNWWFRFRCSIGIVGRKNKGKCPQKCAAF